MKRWMAFAMYRPKEGKRDELIALVDAHVPTLRGLDLVTDRSNYVVESTDGTIIEIFEWVSEEAKDAAHEHPAVAQIWEKMYGVADFRSMADLPESKGQFPGFKPID